MPREPETHCPGRPPLHFQKPRITKEATNLLWLNHQAAKPSLLPATLPAAVLLRSQQVKVERCIRLQIRFF
ncbi:MAG: hypothetical protein RJA70_3072 [Pseudomonadota bacterium]